MFYVVIKFIKQAMTYPGNDNGADHHVYRKAVEQFNGESLFPENFQQDKISQNKSQGKQ
jgi:hypothetical protein